MQPIAVLSAVFALLVSYLEWVSPNPQPVGQSQLVQMVIRDQAVAQPQPSAVVPLRIAKQAQPAKSAKPLNLALPGSLQSIQQPRLHDQQKSVLTGLFEQRGPNERVTYNAELVFDRETGEDITGGKVNIKIPLS